MSTRRASPYIWATWLPKLLTGEQSCQWAVWVKAHYQDLPRQLTDFNQAEWLMQHTALLNAQKAKWEQQGHAVCVEGQNAFRLRGQSATLGGKPDLVVARREDALVIDAKTGRDRPWHIVQVMIYMYALPLALPRYQGVRMTGEVAYPTHTVPVSPESLTDQFVQDLGSLIRRLADERPVNRVPSSLECRFCDISAEVCPERMQYDAVGDEAATEEAATSDF